MLRSVCPESKEQSYSYFPVENYCACNWWSRERISGLINSAIATGDGVAMVHRARSVIKDMEFVQFHPTALYHPGDKPVFLIMKLSGAMEQFCGHKTGKNLCLNMMRVVPLAPRDIVSRAIDNEMKVRGESFEYLDVTHKMLKKPKSIFR